MWESQAEWAPQTCNANYRIACEVVPASRRPTRAAGRARWSAAGQSCDADGQPPELADSALNSPTSCGEGGNNNVEYLPFYAANHPTLADDAVRATATGTALCAKRLTFVKNGNVRWAAAKTHCENENKRLAILNTEEKWAAAAALVDDKLGGVDRRHL